MKKILIIEDNFEVRENLAEILELADYDVVTAENGKVGVEKANSEKPDLILCDVMMPELDGFGVLRILEKKASTSEIPFIFLTAKAEKTDFRKGMNLGADDYITKPFDDVELLDAIEIRLKKSEKIRKAFDGTSSGLKSFIDEARGQRELEKLSQDRDLKKLRKKEFLYMEGDHARSLFFIASGKIKAFKTNEFGKEYITRIYNVGEFLGYNALLQNSPYKETAAALEDTEVSLIPQQDFFSLLHNNRNFAARFVKMLANNVQEQEEKLISLAYNSIRKRVAESLLKLNEQSNQEGQFSILRDDLAAMVGTAKESVIRTLTDFKHENLIHIEGRNITVTNKVGLEDIHG